MDIKDDYTIEKLRNANIGRTKLDLPCDKVSEDHISLMKKFK